MNNKNNFMCYTEEIFQILNPKLKIFEFLNKRYDVKIIFLLEINIEADTFSIFYQTANEINFGYSLFESDISLFNV